MTERASIRERLGVAVSSRNLTQGDGARPLDKIIAIGAASIRERMADAVIAAKYGNEPVAVRVLAQYAKGTLSWMDKRRNWRLGKRITRVARDVIGYWLSDACPKCGGVGYVTVPGSPARSGKACHACNGTMRRAKPWGRQHPTRPVRETADNMQRYKKSLARWAKNQDAHEALLSHLDGIERRAVAAAAKKLR